MSKWYAAWQLTTVWIPSTVLIELHSQKSDPFSIEHCSHTYFDGYALGLFASVLKVIDIKPILISHDIPIITVVQAASQVFQSILWHWFLNRWNSIKDFSCTEYLTHRLISKKHMWSILWLLAMDILVKMSSNSWGSSWRSSSLGGRSVSSLSWMTVVT